MLNTQNGVREMFIKENSKEFSKGLSVAEFQGVEHLLSVLNSAAADCANGVLTLFHYTTTPITSENEVLERASLMDEILDSAESENDMAIVFANAIADRIEEFERTLEYPKMSGADRLRGLMDIKNLTQGDLKDIAPQSVISEILSGKRTINLKQAKGFSNYFDLPIDMFVAA